MSCNRLDIRPVINWFIMQVTVTTIFVTTTRGTVARIRLSTVTVGLERVLTVSLPKVVIIAGTNISMQISALVRPERDSFLTEGVRTFKWSFRRLVFIVTKRPAIILCITWVTT